MSRRQGPCPPSPIAPARRSSRCFTPSGTCPSDRRGPYSPPSIVLAGRSCRCSIPPPRPCLLPTSRPCSPPARSSQDMGVENEVQLGELREKRSSVVG